MEAFGRKSFKLQITITFMVDNWDHPYTTSADTGWVGTEKWQFLMT